LTDRIYHPIFASSRVIPREFICPMSSALLTVEEVAKILKITPRTVYKYRQRLGGFYPFGIKVLRFRREEIYAHLERGRELEIPVPAAGETTFPARIQNQGIGQGGKGEATGPTQSCQRGADPNRHGLFGSGRQVSGDGSGED
jgi:hypothetical protein